MKRREFLEKAAALGILAAVPASALAASNPGKKPETVYPPLPPPKTGPIPVAFLVSDGAVVIDFCGPWEVFQDAAAPGRDGEAFSLYTVAETARPIRTSAGMRIVPEHTFADAPVPKVIVIPAQHGHTPAAIAWLQKSAKTADMTMSVCTGAFLLAKTGLLSGRSATTHHSAFREFASDFSDVHLSRGARWVDSGNVATAGGLASGIDLALHVVERYFGREAAAATAYQMEYPGEGWRNADSNAVYAARRASTDAHPLCAVCDMDVNRATAPRSVYKDRTYLFCSGEHKATFDRDPARWTASTN